MRIVKASNGKAAGADGWSPTELCLLPDGFFEAVALIWEVVLQGATLPPSWKAIRCAGIPKDTGGLRPLSISSIFWRCGSTALLSKMSVWIDEWAPHELAGGLRGRCADSIHESLEESLERIWDCGEPLAGSKLDVEKFFDSCDLEQALAVVDRVGMPREISELLRQFYRGQERYFEVAGVCCPRPVYPKRSFLQGCPWSMMLIAALVALWQKSNHAMGANDVHAGIFVDNRALWATGKGAAGRVAAAHQAGRELDRKFGWMDHPDKRESFASAKGTKTPSGTSSRWPASCKMNSSSWGLCIGSRGEGTRRSWRTRRRRRSSLVDCTGSSACAGSDSGGT